ncbi:hypothetical protein PSHI_47920 [Pseudomonas sp. URMO17WK12:I11]|nr:hypothetical protein PSHI_47920 [Pseudomonas sp. URMO17WK12:I11]
MLQYLRCYPRVSVKPSLFHFMNTSSTGLESVFLSQEWIFISLGIFLRITKFELSSNN